MTVEETTGIDAIGIDRKTGEVILKIFDHLEWTNEYDHLLLLQEKMNSYLRFLESGEVYEAYKKATGRKFVVHIDFAFSPTANGLKFLDTAAGIISDAGFTLVYSIDTIKPSDI